MITYEFSRASIDHAERCEDATLVYMGSEHNAPVFAVIDGMGGHKRTNASGQTLTGREAAQTIRSVLIEDLARLPADVGAEPGGVAETKVVAALQRANQRIYAELNQRDTFSLGERIGAVATVAVVCENGKRLLIGQVGDCRAYMYSAGDFFQICEDEDNVAYLIQQDALSEDDGIRITEILNSYDGVNEPEAKGTVNIFGHDYDLYIAWRWFMTGNNALNIPGANVVINALGIRGDDPTPQKSRFEITAGDILLMCSDGIYKNLQDAELIKGLGENGDQAAYLGETAYRRCQDKQNRRSTVDDISAVVVQFS